MYKLEYSNELPGLILRDSSGVVVLEVHKSTIEGYLMLSHDMAAKVQDSAIDRAMVELPEKILEFVRDNPGRSITSISLAKSWGYRSQVVANVIRQLGKDGKLIREGKPKGVYLAKSTGTGGAPEGKSSSRKLLKPNGEPYSEEMVREIMRVYAAIEQKEGITYEELSIKFPGGNAPIFIRDLRVNELIEEKEGRKYFLKK